jgi:hypothetical protein
MRLLALTIAFAVGVAAAAQAETPAAHQAVALRTATFEAAPAKAVKVADEPKKTTKKKKKKKKPTTTPSKHA